MGKERSEQGQSNLYTYKTASWKTIFKKLVANPIPSWVNHSEYTKGPLLTTIDSQRWAHYNIHVGATQFPPRGRTLWNRLLSDVNMDTQQLGFSAREGSSTGIQAASAPPALLLLMFQLPQPLGLRACGPCPGAIHLPFHVPYCSQQVMWLPYCVTSPWLMPRSVQDIIHKTQGGVQFACF